MVAFVFRLRVTGAPTVNTQHTHQAHIYVALSAQCVAGGKSGGCFAVVVVAVRVAALLPVSTSPGGVPRDHLSLSIAATTASRQLLDLCLFSLFRCT